MKTVKITELRNRLRYYLRLVQKGETILVCNRDRLIARIERVTKEPPADSDAEWLDRLERRGVIRRARTTLPADWVSRAPVVDADVVGALLRDREESP